jgi:hypothetical protein
VWWSLAFSNIATMYNMQETRRFSYSRYHRSFQVQTWVPCPNHVATNFFCEVLTSILVTYVSLLWLQYAPTLGCIMLPMYATFMEFE